MPAGAIMPKLRILRSFDPHNPRHALLLLLGLSLLLMLYQLDGTPFRGKYDDVDRSLIARNMAESGNWLVAEYVRGPLYTKPPLMYWSAAAIGVITGRSDEMPGNLTSVLGMLVMVLATFWAGRNLFDNRTGLWAALLLLTMHLFLAMSRQALLDTPMLGGFALAFGSLIHVGFSGTRWPTVGWLGVSLGLSLAFMTKGPVVLPIFLLMWLPLIRRVPRYRLDRRQWVKVFILMALITLPWPILMLIKAPEAVEVWKFELLGRFGDGQDYLEWTQKPFWFYGPDLINTLPWVLLLPWAVVAAFRNRRNKACSLLLWWAVGGLVFFSLSSATKRSYYLLPLYPAFALLIASEWHRFSTAIQSHRRPGWLSYLGPWSRVILLSLIGLALMALPWFYSGVPMTSFTACGVATTIFGGIALWRAVRKSWPQVLAFLVASAVPFHLAYFGHLVPITNTYHSGKPFFQEAIPLLNGEEVVITDVSHSLAAFYLHEARYRYLEKRDLPAFLQAHAGRLVITRPEFAEQMGQLEPVLEREFREPFGKKKGLGLYRHQQTQPPADTVEDN
jgi:4-amino-4-deoxy-L-arabinose transferase